jgi:hypothetical protein
MNIAKWLDRLDEPERTLAKEVACPSYLEFSEPTIVEALYGMCEWEQTPQKHKFWENVTRKYEKLEKEGNLAGHIKKA